MKGQTLTPTSANLLYLCSFHYLRQSCSSISLKAFCWLDLLLSELPEMKSFYNPFEVTISRDWLPFLAAQLLSQFHQQGCWQNSFSFCSTVIIC